MMKFNGVHILFFMLTWTAIESFAVLPKLHTTSLIQPATSSPAFQGQERRQSRLNSGLGLSFTAAKTRSLPLFSAISAADNDIKPFSTTLLGTILRKIFSPFAYLQRAIFRFVVAQVAGFMTALVKDPACNLAIAHTIKEGMNLFLTQKVAKEKLVEFQQTLSNTEPSLAKYSGEDFLKVFFNFLGGVIVPDFSYGKTTVDTK